MNNLVQFVHGKESGPWGSKISHLAHIARGYGFDVESLDYAGIADGPARVEKLLAACADRPACILVGSSMGGWVATQASTQVKPIGLFLMAPAFDLPDYPPVVPGCAGSMIDIIHGWQDDVIPFAHSVRFGQKYGCNVHLVPDDHRLGATLEQTGQYFELFLDRVCAEMQQENC